MAQGRCGRCSYKLNLKNSSNKVFRRKQNANKVPPNIFKGLEVRKEVRLIF